MTEPATSAQGRRLREEIAQAGGLCTITDLGWRWGVSRQRARQITREARFPAPILTAGRNQELYIAAEADAFRHNSD